MLGSNTSYKMEKYFQSVDISELANKSDNFVVSNQIAPELEYKGYYKFGRVLGRGRFGTVIECLRKVDNKPIAMKFFKCSGIHKWIPENSVIDSDENEFPHSQFFDSKSISSSNHSVSSSTNENRVLPSEVACLIRAAKIPGIVKILDYLPASEDVQLDQQQDQDYDNEESIIGIVLERNPKEICLFDYLLKKQVLSESEARIIIKQLIQINLNLLKAGILHGDLKSENILIEPKTKKIKLIDFGSAQLIDSPQYKGAKINPKLVKTFRGTNLYKPPEYCLNKCFYPRPSTVWTIGIILFDMVCGHFPFENDSEILNHQKNYLKFTRKCLSKEFKNLIASCLAFYVADRINIDKILADKWMQASN